jgi:hypothetical protein
MNDLPQTPKEWLMLGLREYEIEVLADQGQKVEVEKGYLIEVEANGLFKLLSEGKVVAPFDDLDELCSFIKQYG